MIANDDHKIYYVLLLIKINIFDIYNISNNNIKRKDIIISKL